MHIYLTGDTHGEFGRIEEFYGEYDTTPEDVMAILGRRPGLSDQGGNI